MRTKRSVLKPVFEAAIAVVALLLLSPLLLVIALAIVFNTGFPIFFSQPRVGQNGTLFNILKFRTMRGVNHGPSITVGGDSRITPVGRILRKFKCDEIPQLWNVVRGEMSLVGPRPEVPQYVDINNPLWRAVLKARPGITIRPRSSIGMKSRCWRKPRTRSTFTSGFFCLPSWPLMSRIWRSKPCGRMCR